MEDIRTIAPIARIKNDYMEKFGVPRQSGIVNEVMSAIVFEPQYRVKEALRGLEFYSRLWLIWGFSKLQEGEWSPTVRPPRLGGNTRMGVFATRSPFRPNYMGMSCVEICKVKDTLGKGPVIIVSGADMVNGTPIYDIKPYCPGSDSFPDAKPGFNNARQDACLEVNFPGKLLWQIPEDKHEAIIHVLSNDPRPTYQHDEDRIYGIAYGGFDIRFSVSGNTLTVCKVEIKSSEGI